MNWLNPWSSRAPSVPAPSLLSAQRPAQLVLTVRALVRDVTDPGSRVSASELIADARFDEGLLHVYLRPPAGGLVHFRELSQQIRDRLADLPEVRRVAVEAVLSLHGRVAD